MVYTERFTNTNIGILTIIIKENEIYFIGKEIAKILKYSNESVALKQHISEKNKIKIKREDCESFEMEKYIYKDIRDNSEKVLINEDGIFEFIFKIEKGSHKQDRIYNAIKLKEWLSNEVIPYLKEKYNIKEFECIEVEPINNIKNPKTEVIEDIINWLNIEKEKAKKWDLFVEFMEKIGFTFNENK